MVNLTKLTMINHGLITKLIEPFQVVYKKGLENKIFLDQYHIDEREIGGPAMDAAFNGKCCLPQHEHDHARCALRSASAYYKYTQ